MTVLRVLGGKKLMISVPFFVPASLVLLILKYRTLLEISFLEEIKLETEHGQDSTDRRTVEFLKTRIFFTFIYNYLIINQL